MNKRFMIMIGGGNCNKYISSPVQATLTVILSGTAHPWHSMSLIIVTTVLRAALLIISPSSAMIFQPFLNPSAFFTWKETSRCCCCTVSGLVFLEQAGELFLDLDSLSRAALKLAALLRSLVKLLALVTAGLSL